MTTSDLTPGMMATSEWIDQNPLKLWLESQNKRQNQRMLASMVAVSPITVHHWLKGVKRPNDDNMMKLELVTRIDGLDEKWTEWLDRRPSISVEA